MERSVAVVLAAGLGTRMKSKIPKVLHKIAGMPMINHVYNALREAGIDEVIMVLGHQGESVKKVLEPGVRVV